MSDFDKEAEREKLREKYEHDKDKREATEQMSELLLKGATMTNAHCSQCGDPIFRYDGQEFCPTCEKAVERDTGNEGGGDEDGQQGNIEVTDPSDGARVSFGGDDGQAVADEGPSEAAETPSHGPETPAHGERPRQSADDGVPGGAPSVARGAGRPTGGEGVAAARESLVQALARFSEAAAATDDPGRARDHLAAAREAAEALDALDR